MKGSWQPQCAEGNLGSSCSRAYAAFLLACLQLEDARVIESELLARITRGEAERQELRTACREAQDAAARLTAQ